MIVRKSPAEVDRMRAANLLVAEVLDMLRGMVVPGISTAELDRAAEQQILDAGAVPAFKGYSGYPATLCASVNEAVVHGIPTSTPLVEGDIVSLDMGVVLDGFYGDSAITLPVGDVPDRVSELLCVTKEALDLAIEAVQVNGHVSDIGHVVQRHVEAHGLGVVREFVGHGIGVALHEDPQIPNYGDPGNGPQLESGMVLAIEPMVTIGKPSVKVLDDGWTAVTRDGSLAAHFEHTVAVTDLGPEVLTRSSIVSDSLKAAG